jgi:hypothetical protein
MLKTKMMRLFRLVRSASFPEFTRPKTALQLGTEHGLTSVFGMGSVEPAPSAGINALHFKEPIYLYHTKTQNNNHKRAFSCSKFSSINLFAAYLDAIRNCMQKPIEGLYFQREVGSVHQKYKSLWG